MPPRYRAQKAVRAAIVAEANSAMTESCAMLSITKILSLCESQRAFATEAAVAQRGTIDALFIVGDIENLCRAALGDGQTSIQISPHDYGRLTYHLQFVG